MALRWANKKKTPGTIKLSEDAEPQKRPKGRIPNLQPGKKKGWIAANGREILGTWADRSETPTLKVSLLLFFLGIMKWCGFCEGMVRGEAMKM